MRRHLIVGVLMGYVSLVIPIVVQSQDTTETVNPIALPEVRVNDAAMDPSDIDMSCPIAVSHMGWAYGPNASIDHDEEKSTVDIECHYWVYTKNDRQIEHKVVNVCRDWLAKHTNCWGDNGRDILNRINKADFAIIYEERSEESKLSYAAFPDFTLKVLAQIGLEP